jgi:hypothetical protein
MAVTTTFKEKNMLRTAEVSEKIEAARKLRDKWITVLRNGELNQTTGRLANSDYTSFCCLGVAEDRVGEVCGIKRTSFGSFEMTDPVYERFAGPSVAENSVADTALHEPLRIALALSGSQQSMLIILNDSGTSFKTIGDAISILPFYIDGQYYD